jgi:DNA-directed RNA polymerase subunit N (RpoN/RPB10)
MLYISCPTCGYLIGQKAIEYEKKKEEICNNLQLKNKEKEEALSKLLLSLNLRRYCCKMRVMTYKDIIKDIIPVQK